MYNGLEDGLDPVLTNNSSECAEYLVRAYELTVEYD